MLPFHPEPDEALCGFIARCACCLGQPLIQFSRMIGSKYQLRECCAAGWGGGIAAHCGLDPKVLLEQHTSFKVQMFCCTDAERRQFYQESFLQPKISYRFTPFSCKENLIRSNIRFCRKCAAEDMCTLGIPIIRNSWQLPFIDHCSKHKTGLSWLHIDSLETFMQSGSCPSFVDYRYKSYPQKQVLQKWVRQIMASELLPDIQFWQIYNYLTLYYKDNKKFLLNKKILMPYVPQFYSHRSYAAKSYGKTSFLNFMKCQCRQQTYRHSWQLLFVLSQIFPEHNIP